MLNVDKHGFVVGRESDAGNFAAVGAGEKAAVFVAAQHGGHHLVVAHAGIFFHVERGGGHIGLNPQHTSIVESQAIGAAEIIAVDVAFVLRFGSLFIAGQHQNIPFK